MKVKKVLKILKYVSLLMALCVVMALALPLLATRGSPAAQQPFASSRVLVKFKPGTSPAERAALHQAERGKPVQMVPDINVEVVRVPPGEEKVKAATYARSPIVAYAEPDYTTYALGDPNDLYFSKQWGLDNDGQAYKDSQSGTVDADIDAPEAWDIVTGTAEIKIAILDTGIDQSHEDLASKVITSTNFTDSSTANDFYGHGTHVAGIAAAEANNSVGVAGVGYKSSLLNVKVLNDQGSGYYSWIAGGIVWATDNGAKVINMSLGGSRKSRTLEDAVNYAWGKGVVLIAAAGNSDNPSPTYPAKYENCIAVAATDSSDQKASFSSYGSWVDVAAPGVDIYSTFPTHEYAIGKSLYYDYGSGTSMSTPFVSGLAALVWDTQYGTSNDAVRARIETTADPIPGTGQYWTYGRINACNAVGGSCGYGGAEPTPTPAPSGTMYVADITLDLSTVQRGPNLWTYTIATVTIVDQGNIPIEGATVSGHWSGATDDSDSGVTDAYGKVSLESDKVKNASSGTVFTFTVDDVASSGLTYDPTLNGETSNSITVP